MARQEESDAPRILIFGGTGMLGHKLFEALSERCPTFATVRAPVPTTTTKFLDPRQVILGVDALDLGSVTRAVEETNPDVVVNCIGIVKQLKNATDPVLSLQVNALFPHQLTELTRVSGTRLIHVSTDCVFSGRKGKYTEDDPPDPDDLYGRTKLLGEVMVPNCLTIRTSFVGRVLHKPMGLLEWFLSNRGGRVRGFRKALFSGFPTVVLSGIVRDIILEHRNLAGLYHVASDPISKYDLLVRMRDAMGLDIEIEPVDEPAVDRSLDPARFVKTTGIRIPTWDSLISELCKDSARYDTKGRFYANL